MTLGEKINKLDLHERKALNMILDELTAAKVKHSYWPGNDYAGVSIVTEEVGELAKAVNDCETSNIASKTDIECEAAQVGAMGLRFLSNFLKRN